MSTICYSVQCAQILWTPVYCLFEYQCTFCRDTFLDHSDCMTHLKCCSKNTPSVFASDPVAASNDDPCTPTSSIESENTQTLDTILEPSEFEFQPGSPGNLDAFEENANLFGFEEASEMLTSNKQHLTNSTHQRANFRKPIKCARHRRIELRAAGLEKSRIDHDHESPEAYEFSKLLRRYDDLQCDICGQIRTSRRNMLLHMNNHHSGTYKCAQCPKTFATKQKLQLHQSNHKLIFSCEYCGKAFAQKGNLNVHIRTHTGDQPYQCALCERRFSTSGYLAVHTLKHSGEKPFKCPECPKRFLLKSQMKNHLNVHTRERVFKCDICHKTIAKSSMKVHQRTHTGERPYECDMCDRKFTRGNALDLHKNTHTGNSPYACKLCDRSFHSPAARRSHEKSFHGVK